MEHRNCHTQDFIGNWGISGFHKRESLEWDLPSLSWITSMMVPSASLACASDGSTVTSSGISSGSDSKRQMGQITSSQPTLSWKKVSDSLPPLQQPTLPSSKPQGCYFDMSRASHNLPGRWCHDVYSVWDLAGPEGSAWSSSETWVVQRRGSLLSWACGQQDLHPKICQTQKSMAFGPDTWRWGFKECWCCDRHDWQVWAAMQEDLKSLGCFIRMKPPKLVFSSPWTSLVI